MTTRDQTNTPYCVLDTAGVVGDNGTSCGTQFQAAIDAALRAGRDLYVPAGRYRIRPTSTTLTLLTVDMSFSTGAIRIFGDGISSSILSWVSATADIGAGNFALNVINSTEDQFLIIEDLELVGVHSGAFDPNSNTTGTGGGYGLRLANRIVVRNVYSHGFYAGYAVDGQFDGTAAAVQTDHFDTYGLKADGNFYGVYVKGNVGKSRDWNFNRALVSQNQRAGIACADDGALEDVSFIDCHFANQPYGFHKEGSTVQNLFMDVVTFVRSKWEGSGNWAIHGIGTDASAINNGGTINKMTGDPELHGIEVDQGHVYAPIPIQSIARDGSGNDNSGLLTTTGSAAHGLVTGDHFAVIGFADLSGSGGTNELSFNGAFIVTSAPLPSTIRFRIAGSTQTTSQTTGLAGDIGGIRCGVFRQSYPFLSLQTDDSSVTTKPEQFWSVFQMDNDEFMIDDGDRVPSIRIRDGGQNGATQSVSFRVGDIDAYLAKAANSFDAGNQLESASSGNVVKSTATMSVPHAGTALQPGGTGESVTNNVVTRVWAWVQTSGRNNSSAGMIGPGLSYTTNPGNNAILMEDSANPGNVAEWDRAHGVPRRIVGYSINNGSGGLINAHVHRSYITGGTPARVVDTPTAALAAVYNRDLGNADQSILTSTTLYLAAIYLNAGVKTNSITWFAKNTGTSVYTHCWFVLCDSAGVKLKATSDDTMSTNWLANTSKTLSFGTSFTTAYDGVYYLGICVVGTVPTLQGFSVDNTGLFSLAPIRSASATTGLGGPGSFSGTPTLTAINKVGFGYIS